MSRSFCLKPGLAALAAAASLVLPAAAQAAPDLRVAIEFVQPQPSQPNGEVTVRTRMTNASRETANLNLRKPSGAAEHVLRWYYVESGKPDKFVLAVSMQGELKPFSNKWLNVKFKIPGTARPGNHRICVIIDPAKRIPESNEGNNRACSPIEIKRAGGIAKVPGLKPGLKPGPVGPGRIRPKPGMLQRKCINPSIVELQVGIIRKDPRNRFRGTIQLKGVLKNVGNADYITSPNQQSVQLYYGRRLLKNERFGNLRKGQVRIITVQLPWNATTEFQENLKAMIVYDPDIRMDGNPKNDDCNMRDNSKTVRPAQVNRLFTG